jgi:hypothetical protein
MVIQILLRAKPGSPLRELGLVLPKPPTPLRAYIEVNQVGSLLFLSGTIPVVNRTLAFTGRLGENLSIEQGRGPPAWLRSMRWLLPNCISVTWIE